MASGVPRDPQKHSKELQNGAWSPQEIPRSTRKNSKMAPGASQETPQGTKSEKCTRLVRERFSEVNMSINEGSCRSKSNYLDSFLDSIQKLEGLFAAGGTSAIPG